jgi:hypothetical protein
MQAFTQRNASVLQRRGIEPNETNLYTTHFLGVGGGPRFLEGLQQNPDAPASAYVDQAAINANPEIFLRPDGSIRTAREVYANFAGSHGGGQQAQGQQQGQMQPPTRITRMMQSANPAVQQRGIQEYQAWEQQQQAAMQPRDPVTLSAGATLFDPNTNQPIFTAPRAEESTPSSVREYEFARTQGYEGTFAEFQQEQRRAGATSIKMPGQERSFSSAAGTGVAERVFTALDDAQTQQSRLADYERIGQLLNDPSVYTGTGGASIANLKRLGSTLLGLEGLEGVSNVDAAERIRTSLFAGFRQEMLRGATSNADREFIRAIPPNVADSDEGIRLTVELQRRAASAARKRAEILSDMVQQAPDGNLTLQDWTRYQEKAAEIDAFRPEDLERAMRVARQNASQSGPLAGIPSNLISRLPEEGQQLALDGSLTRDEVIQIMVNEGLISQSKAMQLMEAPQ